MGSCLKKPSQETVQEGVVYDPPPGQEGYGYLAGKQEEPKDVQVWKDLDPDFYAVPLEEQPKLDEPTRVV